MRRLSVELAKPAARFSEAGIRNKITRWLSGAFVSELVRYQLEQRDGRWHLQFDFDTAAFEHLLAHRLGRTTLVRSEERRVGKECRCGWWRDHEKEKRERERETETW